MLGRMDRTALSRLIPISTPVIRAREEQLLQRPSQLRGANAQHKADGIHDITFPTSVGADDGGEVHKGSDDGRPTVGFEIAYFQPVQPASTARHD